MQSMQNQPLRNQPNGMRRSRNMAARRAFRRYYDQNLAARAHYPEEQLLNQIAVLKMENERLVAEVMMKDGLIAVLKEETKTLREAIAGTNLPLHDSLNEDLDNVREEFEMQEMARLFHENQQTAQPATSLGLQGDRATDMAIDELDPASNELVITGAFSSLAIRVRNGQH